MLSFYTLNVIMLNVVMLSVAVAARGCTIKHYGFVMCRELTDLEVS